MWTNGVLRKKRGREGRSQVAFGKAVCSVTLKKTEDESLKRSSCPVLSDRSPDADVEECG